jgi:hypothetical protein
MTHQQTIGTRAQVWHGTAYKTSGGLCKADLMQNSAGRIVSKAKHATAKKEMRLLKHGYGTQKGKKTKDKEKEISNEFTKKDDVQDLKGTCFLKIKK